jgi:adenine-specific DNA-methyltransferase
MLKNGLGDLIAREIQGAIRFWDLFSGSGAVSTHVATNYDIPVAAYDLQAFSAVLTRAVLSRRSCVDANRLWSGWLAHASELRRSLRVPADTRVTWDTVILHRHWCAEQSLPLTKAYGGFYFSARQAAWLDVLRKTIPEREPWKTVALASIIAAASQCVASPGHTAQPFRPTRTAKRFLADAWSRDVVEHCKNALHAIAIQHARVYGRSEVGDANVAAASLATGDVAFIDPPYSGVHYSRFYHVLETIASGTCSEVTGAGRYPAAKERPRSRYSLQSDSSAALGELFAMVSSRGAKAIVTFPQRQCSNGLSGSAVIGLASEHFKVEQHWVSSKFSTLGGNNSHRYARRSTRELILVLRPR